MTFFLNGQPMSCCFKSSPEVLFQTSLIEKEARVTNAMLYASRFSPILGDALGNSRGVPLRSASSFNWHSFFEGDQVTHSVVVPDFHEHGAVYSVTLGNLGHSLSAEKQICIVLAMEARVGPNTQDRAEHLTAATGHLFKEVMATCHPPGIAGDVAETSSNTQCALRQH